MSQGGGCIPDFPREEPASCTPWVKPKQIKSYLTASARFPAPEHPGVVAGSILEFLGPLLSLSPSFCSGSLCLCPQFTQSALDCMGVEVCRLRAFLQVGSSSR